jgi:hypothetical protein
LIFYSFPGLGSRVFGLVESGSLFDSEIAFGFEVLLLFELGISELGYIRLSLIEDFISKLLTPAV